MEKKKKKLKKNQQISNNCTNIESKIPYKLYEWIYQHKKLIYIFYEKMYFYVQKLSYNNYGAVQILLYTSRSVLSIQYSVLIKKN